MDDLKRLQAERRAAMFEEMMSAQGGPGGCFRPVLFVAVLMALVTCLLCSGCKSVRVTTTERDSVRVEYRERKVFVPDTVMIQLPPQKEYIITPDSESRLENDYAESYAAVKGGLLHHSLRTKPKEIPIEVAKEIEYRDSIIYRDKKVKVVKVKDVNKLYWWQTALCWIGAVCIAVGAVMAAMKMRGRMRG